MDKSAEILREQGLTRTHVGGGLMTKLWRMSVHILDLFIFNQQQSTAGCSVALRSRLGKADNTCMD